MTTLKPTPGQTSLLPLLGAKRGVPGLVAPRRPAVYAFEFTPGPECDPRPDIPIPEWLRLPFDDES